MDIDMDMYAHISSKNEDVREIFNLLCERIDAKKFTARSNSICLDGTSATGKSTILNKTEMYITKKFSNIPNIDTYPPSAIGCVYERYVESLLIDVLHLEDRSPLNPFDWRLMWFFMDTCNENCDLFREWDFNEICEFIKTDTDTLINWDPFKWMSNKIDTIAIINTNVKYVDNARRCRDYGSDRERSQWPFYTHIQNAYYKLRYGERCIDLNELYQKITDPAAAVTSATGFHTNSFNSKMENVYDGVAAFLKHCLLTKGDRRDHEELKQLYTHRIYEPNLMLPMSQDMATLNAETLVYRAKLRAHVNEIVDKVPFFESMSKLVPPSVTYDFKY